MHLTARGQWSVQRALYTAIAEINGKTALKITITTIERSKHRRVDALVFGIIESSDGETLIKKEGLLIDNLANTRRSPQVHRLVLKSKSCV
jgi:hypothetical protein